MNIGLNAAQARANSSQDMIVFNEITTIMRSIIEASDAGEYYTFVDDNTTMTLSTPESLKIATVADPTITPGNTLIINDQTIVLGTTGSNLNSIIADINDAQVSGVTATKDGSYLLLHIELEQATSWIYSIGTGTANSEVGLTAGTYMASTPSSVNYFNVWQGTETNRAYQSQMDQVIRHFSNLGFKIERLSNTNTSKTFKWHVYW